MTEAQKERLKAINKALIGEIKSLTHIAENVEGDEVDDLIDSLIELKSVITKIERVCQKQ